MPIHTGCSMARVQFEVCAVAGEVTLAFEGDWQNAEKLSVPMDPENARMLGRALLERADAAEDQRARGEVVLDAPAATQ